MVTRGEGEREFGSYYPYLDFGPQNLDLGQTNSQLELGLLR